MQRILVDFNSGAGDVVVVTPGSGAYRVGDHIRVYDLDTDTFDAEVLRVSPGGMYLRVNLFEVFESV